jgi:hypothetical protein
MGMELDDIPGMGDSMVQNIVVGAVYLLIIAAVIGSIAGEPPETDNAGVDMEGDTGDVDNPDDTSQGEGGTTDGGGETTEQDGFDSDNLEDRVESGLNHPDSHAVELLSMERGSGRLEVMYLLESEGLGPTIVENSARITAYHVFRAIYNQETNITQAQVNAQVPAQDGGNVEVSRILIQKETADSIQWNEINEFGMTDRADFYWFNDNAY